MPVFTGSKIGFFGGGQAVSSPVSQYAEASGGVVAEYATPTGDIYRSHTFTASGSLVVSTAGSPSAYDILAVGGGGGGGSSGGGGGAGMVVYAVDQTLVAQTYTVTVGQGGVAGVSSPGTNAASSAQPGNQTAFASPTATLFYAPGGGGGGSHNQDGLDGGSGGGRGRDGTGTLGDGEGSPHPGGIDVESPSPQSVTSGFGRPGGQGPDNVGPGCSGGGGGGAATDGGTARNGPTNNTSYGLGGDGARYTIADGTNIYYGAGGGGGNQPPTPAPFQTNAGTGNPGGNGGYTAFNGPSPTATQTLGQPGLSGRGGGGGGAAGSGGSTAPGGNGGDGTVIVRYKVGATHTASASGGLISAYGGKIIHTFLNSGTFTTDAGFNKTVEYFVLGGGGGGGWDFGGGGGAGGQMQGSGPVNTPTSTAMPMSIGRGGWITSIEASTMPNAADKRSEGTPSVASFPSPIGTTTAGGGGGGGYSDPGPHRPGGDGNANKGCGGGGRGNGPNPGGEANGEGTDGGDAAPGTGGAGGGGIGGPGEDGGETGGPGAGSSGGPGGGGLQLPTTFRDPNSTVGFPGPGPSGFWVGGGGGGSCYTSGTVGSGGNSPDPANPYAGAGYGGQYSPTVVIATAGKANSGAGGGGGAANGTALQRSAGVGGSGLILIAYPE